MMSRISVTLSRAGRLPALLAVFGVACLVYFLVDRDPPGVYLGDVQTKRISDGRIELSYGWRRVRLCDTVVTFSLIEPSGRLFHLAPVSYTAEQMKQVVSASPSRVKLVIPITPPEQAGTYRLQVNAQYSCNATHRLWPIVVTATVPFSL